MLKRMADDGPAEFSISRISEGRKIVIVGLTGAFTTTCHNTHIPGYLENLETLKAKGVDVVIVSSGSIALGRGVLGLKTLLKAHV